MATKIIEKDKRYMVQFPEGTSSEKQAEYMGKVQEKLKSEQFVVIDPKIKLYDPVEREEVQVKEDPKTPVKEPVNVDNTNKPADVPTDNGASDNDKKAETDGNTPSEDTKTESKTEDNKVEETKVDNKVTIEKVEVPAPQKEENILIDESLGREGNVDEE